MNHGLPYPGTYWPAGADRDFYRAMMRKGDPHVSDANVERLAQAGAEIDKLMGRLVRPQLENASRIVAAEGVVALTEVHGDPMRRAAIFMEGEE